MALAPRSIPPSGLLSCAKGCCDQRGQTVSIAAECACGDRIVLSQTYGGTIPLPRVLLSNTPTTALKLGNDALVQSYNEVPYTSFPDAAHHPDRLATIGTLLGLDVAPIPTCRVLEFACGDGSNLVPIATTLPNATFVGFDFAARPVARAQRIARDLGLANIRLLEL